MGAEGGTLCGRDSEWLEVFIAFGLARVQEALCVRLLCGLWRRGCCVCVVVGGEGW